jgi:hypothetical protein
MGSPRAPTAPSAGRGRNKDPWKCEAGAREGGVGVGGWPGELELEL